MQTWHGLIAAFGVPDVDGRILNADTGSPTEGIRLHVGDVTYGRIETLHWRNSALHAVGLVDVDALTADHPDLAGALADGGLAVGVDIIGDPTEGWAITGVTLGAAPWPTAVIRLGTGPAVDQAG